MWGVKLAIHFIHGYVKNNKDKKWLHIKKLWNPIYSKSIIDNT